MPHREAETLSCWLASISGTCVISLDRSETYYATGARQGAPGATQVADRWHMLSNWREATERVFDRHRGRVKGVVLPVPEPIGKPAATVLPAKSLHLRRKYLEAKAIKHSMYGRAKFDLAQAASATCGVSGELGYAT